MIDKKNVLLSRIAEKYPFALGALLPLSHELRTVSFYRFLHHLFRIVSEDSGILNIGYAEDVDNTELFAAQKNLVRLTTERLKRPGQWLDVGCGLGGPACLNAEENPDVTITGININPDQIAEAQKRAETAGLSSRVNFQYGNACAMPLSDCYFDSVYAIETAFHYPDKKAFAHESYRVLKQGGRFAIADIVYEKQKVTIIDPLRLIVGKLIITIPELFTPGKWFEALQSAKFKDIVIHDITRQSFGLYHKWADKLKENREELLTYYPKILVDFFERTLRHCKERKDHGPVSYIVVTAQK